MSENQIDQYFNSVGYGFPTNSAEIELFRLHYIDYDFEFDVNQIDPSLILASARKTVSKAKGIDYHKRTVLAAEIVFQLHKEWSLGHVKLQKLIFLCQNTLNMSLKVNFLKQAMGPYDPRLMRSIDSQLKRHQWFEFRQNSKQKYWPLAKCGGHREWYERYYNDHLSQIDQLLELFRKMRTASVELVATIYACWQGLLKSKKLVNHQSLVSSVYAWSKEKVKFKEEEIIEAIAWMNHNGIYPGERSI